MRGTAKRRDEIAAGTGGLIATAFVDDTYDETIVRLIADEGGPIGFEAGSMTVARLNWLTTTLERSGSRTSLTPTMTAVEACRSMKDAWEIGMLREGAQRLSAVAIGVLPTFARDWWSGTLPKLSRPDCGARGSADRHLIPLSLPGRGRRCRMGGRPTG